MCQREKEKALSPLQTQSFTPLKGINENEHLCKTAIDLKRKSVMNKEPETNLLFTRIQTSGNDNFCRLALRSFSVFSSAIAYNIVTASPEWLRSF